MVWCNRMWVRMRDYECSAHAVRYPSLQTDSQLLVRVLSPRARGRCAPSTLPLSMASSPMSQNAVRASAAFLIIPLAFRGRLAELSRLLINTATLWRPPAQMFIVHRVTGPLHFLLRLPFPELDGQASALLLGWRRCARLNGLGYRFTRCTWNLRHSADQTPINLAAALDRLQSTRVCSRFKGD